MQEKLNSYIEKGLISEQVHPKNADVRIYNYTQKCQFAGAWDEVTLNCRGLIYNIKTGERLSNPFPKFFNYEEHVAKGMPIPGAAPVVTKKYDGSLGILYWLDGEPWIATRGSFASEQAIWATKWFRENVNFKEIDKQLTHLFEIIYPENKIVVSYNFSGLVWLGARHIPDGFEYNSHLRLNNLDDMRRAEKLGDGFDLSYDSLKKLERTNEEGFVLFWPEENLRMKIKFDEYKRLHKIVTGVSAIGIWEELRDGREINFENVPDEFFNWVEGVKNELKDKFDKIEDLCLMEMTGIQEELEKRFDFKIKDIQRAVIAERIKTMTYPSIGFQILDGKDYKKLIWQMIRPKGQSVFKIDDN